MIKTIGSFLQAQSQHNECSTYTSLGASYYSIFVQDNNIYVGMADKEYPITIADGKLHLKGIPQYAIPTIYDAVFNFLQDRQLTNAVSYRPVL